MPKRVVILGVTGSIGTQALTCLDDTWTLVGASYGKNTARMTEIVRQFPHLLVYSPHTDVLNNVASLEELIRVAHPDLVVNAIVGWDGLNATIFCLENGYHLALANKESLVIAGAFIRHFSFEPVDSEHSTLHELMQVDPAAVTKIYITASGGPFYKLTPSERECQPFAAAVKHPRWQMGAKISVDSATMVNKCFELIEAHHLFPGREIVALYHPEAVVHSLVEFRNGSVWASMSTPDMRLPIDLAIHGFERGPRKIAPLDFTDLHLTFARMNPAEWLPLQWAQLVIRTDNRAVGAIVNTVNDWAFTRFRDGQITFGMITKIIDVYVQRYANFPVHNLADLWTLHDQILAELEVENDHFWFKK